MTRANEIAPAPKRGRYDRALSRHERQTAQQERVVGALAAVAVGGGDLSVARVVEHAGIGRNTFYEYFDDIPHALSAIRGRARRELVARVESALQHARTPHERIRGIARAWVDGVTTSPSLMQLALRAPPSAPDPAGLSELARYVAKLLVMESHSADALPGLRDEPRTIAVAGVFDALTRAHLTNPMTDGDLQRLLAECALRLLR